MNKSFITNLVAVLIIVGGYFSPVYRDQILSVGFFAFSGAITNWIAIYMLFEKVPFLYGSGVIPNRFEEFKAGIKYMIMTEFFTDENVDRFFQGQKDSAVGHMSFDKVIDSIDFNLMFDRLIELVMESHLGQMLSMMGAQTALEPLRPSFKEKMNVVVKEMTHTEAFLKALEDNILPSHVSKEVVNKVEEIVDKRLEELTPQMVKDILQRMIREHLGWLVVWGGVFGGLIGLVMSYVQ